MANPFRFLALFIPVLLLGCNGQAEQSPIWVGHLAPLSGPDKASGRNAERGIDLAVAEANRDPAAQGAGRPVRVLHADTQGNPKAFGAEATRLVAVNQVAALLGGWTEADLLEFQRSRAHVLLISPSGLPREALSSNAVFFTGLSPAQKGQALARFAAEQEFRRVIVVVNDDPRWGESQTLAEVFARKVPELARQKKKPAEVHLVGPLHYGKETSLEKRFQLLPDEVLKGTREGLTRTAFLVAGPPPDVRRLRQKLGRAYAEMPILYGGPEGETAELREILQEGPGAGRGMFYLATAYLPEADTEANRALVKRYQKDFGEAPDVHAALAYDDARLLFTALRRVGSTEADAVRKELMGLKDFPGLTGPLSFDKLHQARRPTLIARVQGGKVVLAGQYPAEP